MAYRNKQQINAYLWLVNLANEKMMTTRGYPERRGKVLLFPQFYCELHYFCTQSSKIYDDLKFGLLFLKVNDVILNDDMATSDPATWHTRMKSPFHRC